MLNRRWRWFSLVVSEKRSNESTIAWPAFSPKLGRLIPNWYTFDGARLRKLTQFEVGMLFSLIWGMITIQDFKSSSFEKKCDVVTTQSNYIANRNMGNCKVYLYHSGEFFIEVFYSPIYKKVLMINAFNDIDSLVPYIDKVSISSLDVSAPI